MKTNKSFHLHAMELISEKFYNSFVRKISDWCTSHGIEFTGHFMCDNYPFWSIKYTGRFLQNLATLTLPGIDEIFSSFEDVTEMALFGAAEYACKKRGGGMVELFALGPCDMTYAKKRCLMYLSACHKINHYFALSHMDLRGNMLMTDYFSNISPDAPDAPGMRLLSEEAKKCAEYAKHDYTPHVYIRYPTVFAMKKAADNLDIDCIFTLSMRSHVIRYSGNI